MHLYSVYSLHCVCVTYGILCPGQRFFTEQASPLLYEVSWQAAKLVKCPNADFDTVYDEWLHFTPKDYNGEQKPL